MSFDFIFAEPPFVQGSTGHWPLLSGNSPALFISPPALVPPQRACCSSQCRCASTDANPSAPRTRLRVFTIVLLAWRGLLRLFAQTSLQSHLHHFGEMMRAAFGALVDLFAT